MVMPVVARIPGCSYNPRLRLSHANERRIPLLTFVRSELVTFVN